MKYFSIRVSLLLFLFRSSSGFRWKVNDPIEPSNVLTLSERFMFASHDGPALLEQGDSTINMDTKLRLTTTDNSSTNVEYAIYSTDYEHRNDAMILCSDLITEKKWATNILRRTVATQYKQTTRNFLTGQIMYIWEAHLRKDYIVNVEAWHNVAIEICTYSTRVSHADLQGEVAFKNPYGYIPAELYGLRPFEAARTLLFIFCIVFFLYFYLKYQEAVMPLHTAIFGVLIVASIEAAIWFAAYESINITGHPYCCPFPPVVVAALVMQIFRQTLSRTLLLVVSLGYGIVRPKLLRAEWLAIAAITVIYFSIATTYEVSNIIALDVHPSETPASAGMVVPSMLIDMLFLTWIYLALTSTIRILTEFQQTHKLQMYNQLFTTIAVFSMLFIIVSMLSSMKTSGVLQFPWQWSWLQQVSWEVLNFAVLATVCVICRPSDTSRMLSYASQLPQDDPDDFDDEMHGDDNDGDPYDNEEEGGKPKSKKPSASSLSQSNREAGGSRQQFSSGYSLPDAADDDEFGLGDGGIEDEDDRL